MALYPVDGPMQTSHSSNSGPVTAGLGSFYLPYHAQSVEGALLNLETSLQGLSEAEAAERMAQAEPSPSREREALKPRQLFMNGYKKWVSLLFLGAAGISFFSGQPVDGILILVAMLVNGGVQGLIHWHSLKSKSDFAPPDDIRCTVRREGQTLMLSMDELVIGDILLIQGGQMMPADARLLSATQIQTDEALLTGESILVPKNAGAILHPAEEISEQCNMLFAGTVVKTGKGEAVVTALGDQTIMGKIAAMARNTEKRESPFTQRLNRLSFRFFLLATVLTVLVIAVGLYRGLPAPQLIQLGLIMTIAAFPETIPGLASLILSMGIERLGHQKVLVKSFHALEAVGDITTVCTDKTGTLTENYLTFAQMFLPEMGIMPYDARWRDGEGYPCPAVESFLRIGRLNNGTVAEGFRSALMGDPIDVALYRSAAASLERGYHIRLSLPFDPVKLRSATLCETPDKQMMSFIKGAPEAVLESCRYYLRPDGTTAEMSVTQRSEFLMFNRKLAYEHNLRVIGFAQKLMQDDDPYAEAVFVGWVALLDPPKPGVLEAVERMLRAGTRVMMITGDQKATAEMTARELGIVRRQSDEVWLRSDLEASEQGIRETVRVFARTRPEEKLAIVESLQRSGQVVAMVGDGVNDSPALQKSDVAIAMGLQGSDAAKDSADIILLNDRLEGILHAVLESRVLRRKIHSCMRYLLSCNLGLLLFIAGSVLLACFGLGKGMALGVVQLLWLNLVISLVPTLVLAVEPVREAELPPLEEEQSDKRQSYVEIYKQKALQAAQPIRQNPLDQNYTVLMAYWAGMIMLAGLSTYWVVLAGLKQTPEVAGTAAFCALALAQTFNLFNIQALNAGEDRKSFMSELANTPVTWLVALLALLMQAMTVYVPLLADLFGTVALPALPALVALGFGGGLMLLSLKSMNV